MGTDDNLIETIRKKKRTLRPAEQRVAEVVLRNPQRATRLSTAAMAAAANVSEPTVSRFCRAIACDGFPDFKLRLAQQIATQEYSGQLELEPSDRALTYTNKVIEAARSGLHRFANRIEPQRIEEVVDTLLAARKIHFFGTGASGPVAMDATYKFMKLCHSVMGYTDDWSQRMAVASIGDGDAVVCISYTGRTIGMVNVARLAREAGAAVVAITKADSPLAEVAHTLVPVEAPEETTEILPRHSRLVHFAAIEVVAAGFILRKGHDFRKRLQKVQESLEVTRLPKMPTK